MCQCNSLEGVAGLALVQETNAKIAMCPLSSGVLIVLMLTANANQRGTISSEGSCCFDEHQCWLLGIFSNLSEAGGSGRSAAECEDGEKYDPLPARGWPNCPRLRQ